MPDKAYSFSMILTQPIAESQQAQPLWLRFFAESGGFFGALFPYRGPFFVEKSRELCGSCIRQSPFILYENRVNSTFLY